ncbi:hypothetical protein, partial [Nocardiopsis sp. BMP B8015]
WWGQNKHGLKKIKHALLSSQETTAHPVQARPLRVCRFSVEGAVVRFRFVVSSLYQVFRIPPNRRFVCS